MSRRCGQRGVTLPELLIALLVFAFIAGVGVAALRLAIDGREQLIESDDRLREWQLARLIIRSDLAQIAHRTVRDEFGDRNPASVIGGVGFSDRPAEADEAPLMGFVRGGWSNFDGATPRSTLQYVEYVFKDGALVRRTRSYLDDARNQPNRERILFADVEDAEISFLVGETSRGLDWAPDWPVTGAGPAAPPVAIQMSFRHARLGDVEQLFWIGELFQGATP
ncbi:MAG: type II secretion system minor pseudopilin GspJ [Pseudomonadota bacterium]